MLDLATLNEPQRQAVTAPEGPVLVLAGAGSGKTRVLVARLARLMWGADPIPAERILAISFTRKACGEIRERLAATGRALGAPSQATPVIDTFHATALKVVRDALRPIPRILDEGPEAGAFFARFMAEDPWLRSRAIPRERLEEALIKQDTGVLTRGQAEAVRRRFRAFKLRQGVMSLDDLVPLALRSLEGEAARRRWQARFDVVLVDEFQDVDDGQMALFEILVGGGARFCLFGDDDQAIYRWRGSNPECLREVARRPDVQVSMLPTNYRSRPPILDLAREVIEGDPGRLEKPVIPARAGGALPRVRVDEDDGAALAEEVQQLLRSGRPPSDLCVLVRDHVDGRRVIRVLEEGGITAIPAGAEGHRDPMAVTVQTYHGAKGLEYPVVVMPFMDKGRFPNTKRLSRERRNLMADLEDSRAARRQLRQLRAARRRKLVRLWWVIQSAWLPPADRPPPRTLAGRLAYALAMGAERLWLWWWSGDIRRSLILREARARAWDGAIAAARPKALRWHALEEAAAAWGDEARALLAEERRLCYVAITRAKDQWVAVARSREAASPFIAGVGDDRIQWVETGGRAQAQEGFDGW